METIHFIGYHHTESGGRGLAAREAAAESRQLMRASRREERVHDLY